MSDSIISKDQIRSMVVKYRNAPSGGINPATSQQQELTHFVHFTFAQLIELLIANNIVATADTIETILQSRNNFGFKVYLAQHATTNDCPNNNPDFIGRNTVVIVNTVKVNNVWYDMPDMNNTIPGIQQYVTSSSGKGTDKSEMCPPQCAKFSGSL